MEVKLATIKLQTPEFLRTLIENTLLPAMNKKKTLPSEKFSRDFSGYTLIEILIAITIIGLIFSVGYINYRQFSRKQALFSVARGVKSTLRFAQERALAGEKPSEAECLSQGSLNGYDFFVDSNVSYRIQANCTGGLVDVKTISLPQGITISSSPARFTFKVIGAGTNLSSDATITLTQVATGNVVVITVTPGGEIK